MLSHNHMGVTAARLHTHFTHRVTHRPPPYPPHTAPPQTRPLPSRKVDSDVCCVVDDVTKIDFLLLLCCFGGSNKNFVKCLAHARCRQKMMNKSKNRNLFTVGEERTSGNYRLQVAVLCCRPMVVEFFFGWWCTVTPNKSWWNVGPNLNFKRIY